MTSDGRLEHYRLECLKLALQRTGANDPRPPLAIAEEFFAWVEGQAAPAPSEQATQEAGKATGRKAGAPAARQ